MAEKTSDRFDREPFMHHVHTGEHGELLFDAPVEIRTKEDLDFFGISWRDTKTLRFGRSERINVYYYRTENRAYADDQWRYLSTKHSGEYASTRCFIKGNRKKYVRCEDRIPCKNCPHKGDRKPPFISLDELVETGYEPAAAASFEEDEMAISEYESIRTMMDQEDERIAAALEARELHGLTVKEIAAEFHLSPQRVYQLLDRAKAIGRKYRTRYPDT